MKFRGIQPKLCYTSLKAFEHSLEFIHVLIYHQNMFYIISHIISYIILYYIITFYNSEHDCHVPCPYDLVWNIYFLKKLPKQ